MAGRIEERADGNAYETAGAGSSRPALLLRYDRFNRYSLLALLAGLETCPALDSIPVFWTDPRRNGSMISVLDEYLEAYDEIILCYSFMTFQWPVVRQEILSLARYSLRERLTVIAGGPHPSGAPRRTLEAGFDAVCVGEGDLLFPRFVLARSGAGRLEDIPGLYVRSGTGFLFTGNGELSALGDIPPFPFTRAKFGPIEITRGCPFGCKYCQTPVFKGKKVRHRPLHSIFEAVERLVETDRVDIRFITPNALAYGSNDGRQVNRHAVELLLKGIRDRLPERGRIFFGSFPSEVRPDFVDRQTADLMQAFCDNKRVVIGAQSGNPNMLLKMRRGHDPDDVRRACRTIVERGFQPVVDFILGLPGETPRQMSDTLTFMEELAGEGVRLHAHAFMPLPGSPWAGLNPTPIPAGIRRKLEWMATQGSLFGQWQTHEKMLTRWISGRKSMEGGLPAGIVLRPNRAELHDPD